jgi:hypothetical protein
VKASTSKGWSAASAVATVMAVNDLMTCCKVGMQVSPDPSVAADAIDQQNGWPCAADAKEDARSIIGFDESDVIVVHDLAPSVGYPSTRYTSIRQVLRGARLSTRVASEMPYRNGRESVREKKQRPVSQRSVEQDAVGQGAVDIERCRMEYDVRATTSTLLTCSRRWMLTG